MGQIANWKTVTSYNYTTRLNVVTEVIQLMVDNRADFSLKKCRTIWLHFSCYIVAEVALLLMDNGAEQNLKYWYKIRLDYSHNLVTEVILLLVDKIAGNRLENH